MLQNGLNNLKRKTMNGLEFKDKLKEYINSEYEILNEQRKDPNHNNSLESVFLQKCQAEQLLLQYIETLKYTKKRCFRKPETLYKDVKIWEFSNFWFKYSESYRDHPANSIEANLKRWYRYKEPYSYGRNIIHKILKDSLT
jgi:hypothetical protein